jgi:hypothetical protein
MKLIFLSAPFAHTSSSPHLTTYRHQKMNDMVRQAMKDIGVQIVDATAVTKSMWEAAWDGLRYSENVVSMVSQLLLNAIVPSGIDVM